MKITVNKLELVSVLDNGFLGYSDRLSLDLIGILKDSKISHIELYNSTDYNNGLNLDIIDNNGLKKYTRYYIQGTTTKFLEYLK